VTAPAGHDVLARIAADRRRRVEALQIERPGHVLRARLAPRAAGRLERALRRGASANPIRLLCEVKRASPSRGPLDLDIDPVARATLYEQGGAAAVSLVTEPDHFLGDPGWVDAVRPAVGVPLLMKDFVVDSWQLLDAAERGADGVLLIAALLSPIQIQRYVGEARLLGLDALVEVHDETELNAALWAGATLVGINNRDLRTFEVRLETGLELLPLLPPHVTAVAESGYAKPADVEALRSTRCDAVLIGEAFMTSPNPAATLTGFVAAARGAR
jgi:indole-3-glycerol phosphate synthase